MNIKLKSDIILSENLERELNDILKSIHADRIFIAVDENTNRLCWPLISSFEGISDDRKVVIPAGEESKNINTLAQVWKFLCDHGASRKSIIINLGGGMLTDLCGFAASTFKRGIPFINIPTTLLAQVDASVGGKTGIDFNGLKNEIGAFSIPKMVFIDTRFLRTIDHENFLSGYAEMIKHGLIFDVKHWTDLQEFDIQNPDYDRLKTIIGHSVSIKEHFVLNDPTEQNIRKALNFGHTVGHAFESYALRKNAPILHGYAVAYGMICELFLSHKFCGFPMEEVNKISKWIIAQYGRHEILSSDFEALFQLMTHDKKNESGKINFSLIKNIGQYEINCYCSNELIKESLEYFQQVNK
ncbi:MAG: 3-dehydroquinate synthase [Bacteroidota bacterium]|nr:3-dehydroquinate synthase [Bacteroidota bacterium]MDP4206020.1 3-dehydroquinate synthase [Bacteroidota bacterium]